MGDFFGKQKIGPVMESSLSIEILHISSDKSLLFSSFLYILAL